MTERDDALKELGRMVTERRESIGMTLETVFDRTKIRPEYLRGIEQGDYRNFPEIVYIKGFVRTYLKLIDAEDLYEDFAAQLDRTQSPQKKQEPRQQSQQPKKNMNQILGNGSSAPKGFKPASHFWLFLVLIMALVGTGAYVWYAVSYGGLDLRNMKLFNFGGNGAAIVAENLSSDIITPPEVETVGTPVSVEVTVSEEPEPEPEPYLEIHAANDVWLSVTIMNAPNAQPIFRRTMRRGESMRWDLTAPIRAVIGRPNAAQVVLNGRDLGIVNPSAKRSETYIYNPDGTYTLQQRRR